MAGDLDSSHKVYQYKVPRLGDQGVNVAGDLDSSHKVYQYKVQDTFSYIKVQTMFK